jgi:uncharacterized membrane protein
MTIFGRSEVAIRMLSFIFYALTVWIGYKFAKIIPIKSKWFTPVTTLLFILNPMLIYYAFEARVYSLVSFLVMGFLYFFMKKNARLYIIFSTLALYAHPYSIFALISQGVYVFFWKKPLIKTFMKQVLIIVLLYLPWIFVILLQISKSAQMWYYPVTGKLVRAIAGNMYIGFEGTPDFVWEWSIRLSVIIIGVIALSFWNRKVKDVQRLLLISFLLPLIAVIGISFFKPIFTQRYLIYTTLSEILLIAIGLFSISQKTIRVGLIISVLLFLLYFNTWYPPKNTKVDFRTPLSQINSMIGKNDIILNSDALTFFDVLYYARDQERVYLLQESDASLPRYVGAILIPRSKWMREIPKDTQVFLVHPDGTYEIIKS